MKWLKRLFIKKPALPTDIQQLIMELPAMNDADFLDAFYKISKVAIPNIRKGTWEVLS